MKRTGLALSLCALAAGCGGGDGALDAAIAFDAVADDAAIVVDGFAAVDGAVDAAPGVATEITVLDPLWRGEPVSGLTVVFTEEARTQTAVTDAAGHAVAQLGGPATVTVIRPPPAVGFSVVSVYGVLPGERIVFGPPDLSDAVRATMEIEVPQFDGAGGPYDYRMYTSCSSSWDRNNTGPRQSVRIDRPCDRFDIHVEAVAATQLQATLTVTGQTVVDGGVLALTGAWVLPTRLTIQYTGLPDGHRVAPGVTPYFRSIRSTAQDDGVAGCEDAVEACTFRPWASPAADRIAAEATVAGPDGWGRTQSLHAVFAATDDATYTVPIQLLPWVSDLEVDRSAARVTWRATAGDAADAVAVIMWIDDLVWVLLAPPGSEELRLPDLSAAGVPSSADIDGASLMLIDRADVEGYDELRPAAEPLTWTSQSGPTGSRISNSEMARVD